MRAKGEGSIYWQHESGCPHVEGCDGWEVDGGGRRRRCTCRTDGDCAGGRWVAQVDAGYKADGSRRRIKRRCKTKAEARRVLTVLLRESDSPAAREDITVTDWLDLWFTDFVQQVHAGQRAPTTARGYEIMIRQWLKPALGHLRLDRVTAGDVNRMMTAVMAAGAKPQTAKNARACLSSAMAAAVAEGLVTANVVSSTRAPTVPRKPVSAFNDGEYDKIMVQCDHNRIGPAVEFFLEAGLRVSELCGLLWAGIDLEEMTYQVTEGLHHIGKQAAEKLLMEPGLVSSKPKNVLSGEPTPMSPEAAAALRRQRKQQAADQLAAERWVDSGRVFTEPDGQPLSPSKLRKEFRKLLKDAGVATHTRDGRGRALHELRRTWTSRKRDAGVPIEYVQRLGRWASPQMLLETYRALDEQELRRAAGQGDGHP